MPTETFLPMSRREMEDLGWDRCDFIVVTGDAYVDHPSFGHAIIARVLDSAGYKVGIISQPNWRSVDDFKALGRPRFGFLVSGGNMDSMVSHYTVNKSRRKKDAYSPGGKAGLRPDRATIVYTQKIKEAYKKIPIILGGIEASLRRFSHYDYWEDRVRRSILYDSEADILVYGMGELQILEIAEYLANGVGPEYIRHIPGTVYLIDRLDEVGPHILLPSYDEVIKDKTKYAQFFMHYYQQQDPVLGQVLVQPHDRGYIVQNPPMKVLDETQLDWVYGLTYQRTYHPSYEKLGGVPAIKEVKLSIISQRGCFGACNFCALTFHQGRIVQSRSHESILNEARRVVLDPDFKGYIHDVGGPTANFRNPSCQKQFEKGSCQHKQCLYPSKCEQLDVDHSDFLSLLRKVRAVEGVKKVFIRSGLRYDYLVYDDDKVLKELVEHHVSGQMKVAPEHIDPQVLHYMGKPGVEVYDQFVDKYFRINKELGKEQYVVPYLISSHPGSDLKAAIKLAEYLRDHNYNPEQVQDFYPTPGTLSTCMYYTELDPRTMKKVFVPKTKHDKAMQRALLQYKNPRNYQLVYEALKKAGRMDLVGTHNKSLIKPKK